ncbi:uncharacterized protein MEPE_03120 [Melanopsichium pennsylvanicum]|uniref:Uncharacterized protein n=2 Tax=Melanopsichium pennsylvanicum TaxID=63383 RepID=A0AAJ4XM15_9BASI|nr:putative protein [Melanopsichium pennsylvanicum 4]SNX84411.1 uncharacterized protein MEPE_03120 [Melanopsichium pennsylvanicum]
MQSTQSRGGSQQHYMASLESNTMNRQYSDDQSLNSVRYPSNASQPSLSHSINTYTESTPSSVCRPDFGDYSYDMAHSDCGASFVSEVPPSFDDTSDTDEVVATNNSKPTMIKFVEPVVQREHRENGGKTRLTGMKKKIQKNKLSHHDGASDVHHLPLLGFADARTRYAQNDGMHQETLNFPSVPPREVQITPKQEQWNVDTIDIALEDLVLDKGKMRSRVGPQAQSPFTDAAADATFSPLRLRAAMANRNGMATTSILDETQQDDRQFRPPTPRTATLSDARISQRTTLTSLNHALQPLPHLPSAATNNSCDSTAPSSTSGKTVGLQPSVDHPLAPSSPSPTADHLARNHVVVNATPSSEEEENVFAFSPPSLSSYGVHADSARPRIARVTGKRLDSISSSNHSSLLGTTRDMDPREVIQRARMQHMSCGLDAEIGDNFGEELASECATSDSHSKEVYAEDLPPLLSNHYLQGKVDQVELERLNRLPERMAAAAAADSGSHKLSQKHLSKHSKKTAAATSVQQHYEPISILRAEAAFLKEDTKKNGIKGSKMKLWNSHASSSNTSASGSRSSGLGRMGIDGSTSDLSSVSDGPQRLRSFKSSLRLKGMR